MSYNEPITIEEFKDAMPAHIRKNINPEMIRCRDHDEAEYLWNYCGGTE